VFPRQRCNLFFLIVFLDRVLVVAVEFA